MAWGTRVRFARAPVGERAAAIVALFAGAAFLAVLPGLAALAVYPRASRLPLAGRVGVVLAGAGVAGMIGFWATFVTPGVGQVAGATILAGSVLVLAVQGGGHSMDPELGVALGFGLLIGLGYAGLAFLRGGIGADATHAVAVRYWVAPDNAIPLLFAERMLTAQSLRLPLLGDWHSADRPPLQTGLFLLQVPLMRDRVVGYQMLATGLQAAWAPALWALLRTVQIRRRTVMLAIGTVAMTGVCFANTVYVWPKMLAAALILAAAAITLGVWRGVLPTGTLPVVGALAALSMLAHGGTAFVVVGMLPWVVILAARHRGRAIAAAAGAAAVIYVPWMLYQHFVDPPGNRLLKWEIAGRIPVDTRSFTRTLIAQYRAAGITGALRHKASNLVTLIGQPSAWRTERADPGWHHSFLGLARLGQLNNLAIAAGPLLLGLIALLHPSTRRRLAPCQPIAVLLGLSLAAWTLMLFGGVQSRAILAEGSYAVVLLALALLAVAVLTLPGPLKVAALVANTAWFVVCWAPGWRFRMAEVGTAAGRFDPAALIVCAVGVVGAIAVVMRTANRPQPASTPAGVPAAAPTADASEPSQVP